MSRRFYHTNTRGNEYVLDMSEKEVEILCKYFAKYDSSYFMKHKTLMPISYTELEIILKKMLEKENGFKHLQYILEKEKGNFTRQNPVNIGYRWVDSYLSDESETYISLPFLFARGTKLKVYVFTYTKEYAYHTTENDIEIDGVIKKHKISCDKFEVKKVFEVTENGLQEVVHKGISAFSLEDNSANLLGLYTVSEPYIDNVDLEMRLIDYYNIIEDYKTTEALDSLFNTEMYKRIMEFFNTESDYNKNVYREVIRFLSNSEGYNNLSLVEFEKKIEFLSEDWFKLIYN